MSASPVSGTPKQFYWRAFTSFFVILGFLVLGTTGLGLFVSPAGRIANWSGWTFAWLTKAQWQSVHLVFGILFLVAGGVHLFFNWRVLMSYLRSHIGAGMRRKWELTASAAAVSGLVILSAADVPPVSMVAEFRETVANSWASPFTEPPIPHAELLTLAQFSEAQKIPIEKALTLLGDNGLAPDTNMTLAQVAAALEVTPQEIYRRLGARKVTSASPVPGGGMGWKTLRAASAETGVPIETAVARLAAAGINADPETTLRDIASRYDKHAPDLLPIIKGSAQ